MYAFELLIENRYLYSSPGISVLSQELGHKEKCPPSPRDGQRGDRRKNVGVRSRGEKGMGKNGKETREDFVNGR